MLPNEKLAESLATLRDLQRPGRRVFQSADLSRTHRERLLKNGFLQEIVKGWLISSAPDARDGDSTPWYTSFWEFCVSYCGERFGEQWHLSPEQSLLLHAEKTVVPEQVVVYAAKGRNHKLVLPFRTSLFDLKVAQMPRALDLMDRGGLRVFTPAAALVRITETFIAEYPVETRVVLASLPDVSELLRQLLDGGRSVVAGRLAGALRGVDRGAAADEIIATMTDAGYQIRESDPFTRKRPAIATATPPIVGRMQAMWDSMRSYVALHFPAPPKIPRDPKAYMRLVDDVYQNDAYHSLSIEGYNVSGELIERVRAGDWDPERNGADRQSRDALAARGYWQAFQAVKIDLGQIISGTDPSPLVRMTHANWYRQLFQPCVAAGLVPASALAGYRGTPVYLRASRYVPPRWEAVRDAMPALFELLDREPIPGVRAVLGHWLFGYIHPYPDGNGRMARFLMNAMLASGGYPWTIIQVEDRNEYLSALDSASIDGNIGPFTGLIAERVRQTVKRMAVNTETASNGMHGRKKVAKRARVTR